MRGSELYTKGGYIIDFSDMDMSGSQMSVGDRYGWEASMWWSNLHCKDLDNAFISVEEGDVFVDLGANIGMSSIHAENKGASKIICIEPVYSVFHALVLNSRPNWILENVAISDKEEIFSLAEWPCFNGEMCNVKAVTLDSILDKHNVDKIDYLKIDIEGAEKEVVKTWSDETISKIQKMFVEFHDHSWDVTGIERSAFIDFFVSKGFKCEFVIGNGQSFLSFRR